ncbi:hypothetical protein DMUE_5463, partial [Dictyocoela muelleri]
FFTLRAYINQIDINVTKLALCLGWSEQMKLEKIHEIFFCGLDEGIKFELTKLPNKDHNTILKTLLDMKHFLIDKIFREQPIETFEFPKKDYKYQSMKNIKNKMIMT